MAGVLVTAFIIAVGPIILGSMGLEAGVVTKAKGYVWARALGSIGHLLVLVGSGSFRGMQVWLHSLDVGFPSNAVGQA